MTVLAFGANGQVGTALARLEGVTVLSRAEADLSIPGKCAQAIDEFKPVAVINAAAYTAVDQAESDEALATAINGDAPGEMARACAALGIPLVHISTDYVFAGDGDTPFNPSDPVAPLGAYGRSKEAGERAVREVGSAHVVLRTSWVFSETGTNFVKTMLKLGAERAALSIVDDQYGGPTSARDIAATALRMVRALLDDPSLSGTYHYAGAPDCSWADFATQIFDRAGLDVEVTRIPSSAYPTPAKRPLNSRMACATTTEAFGIERPDWRVGLDEVLRAMEEGSHDKTP